MKSEQAILPNPCLEEEEEEEEEEDDDDDDDDERTNERTKWVGHVVLVGETGKAYRILIIKPKGKSSHGRPRHKWEEILKK
jgi:hypothetical protein